MMPPLVLLDIDGTLLTGPNTAHHEAIVAGLETVYELNLDGFRFLTLEPWGKTDLQIAHDCLDAHHVDEQIQAERIQEWASQAVRAHEGLAAGGPPPSAAAGAERALEQLCERGARLGLVTGNLREIAVRKLESAGLGAFFVDAPGGFGSDHRERAELVGLAQARAGGAEGPWPVDATAIVGDTPRDIACARSAGVACVAVTTGPFDAHQLAAADAVISGLGELVEALERLNLLEPPS